MRSLIGLYLSLGLVLLLFGFFATGSCPTMNKDVVSDTVFVVGWPVYLYKDVVQSNATVPQWLHRQACQGGVGGEQAGL
jgi:hypothetical protein